MDRRRVPGLCTAETWISFDQFTERDEVARAGCGNRAPDDTAVHGLEFRRFDDRATHHARDRLDVTSQCIPGWKSVLVGYGALSIPQTTELRLNVQQLLGLTLELIEMGAGRQRSNRHTDLLPNSPDVRLQAVKKVVADCPKTGGLSPWRTSAPCRATATIRRAGYRIKVAASRSDSGHRRRVY